MSFYEENIAGKSFIEVCVCVFDMRRLIESSFVLMLAASFNGYICV